MIRAATIDDLEAVAVLQQGWDTSWFGASEHSVDEVRETFERSLELGGAARVAETDGRLVAAAWHWERDAWLAADLRADLTEPYGELLDWLAASPQITLDALDRDERLRDALTARGWRHAHSSFELIRPVTPDWDLPQPQWAPGVRLGDYETALAAAVHRLVYVDAGWTEIPGHPHRELEEWRAAFLTGVDDTPLLAWRGDRLVGVAITRKFDDGTHWVGQLAVARDERRSGIGRALLLTALRRGREAGAARLGLSVQAQNRSALGLYVGVGLRIDREWMSFEPPHST